VISSFQNNLHRYSKECLLLALDPDDTLNVNNTRYHFIWAGLVALPAGCQIRYMDHAGCHQLNRVLSRVSDWLHGAYWLSSIDSECVLTAK
jgi:hypothetical protein